VATLGRQNETMILMKNILFIFLTINLTSCSTSTPKSEVVKSDTSSIKQTIENFPKVEMKISLIDTNLNYGDKILLNISLTNNSNEEQKLLFDKPTVSTGGPWATTGKVMDIDKKTSVLKYENKAMLSSQLYTEDELKDKYYNLKPGQTINGQYELTDIVVFNYSNNSLPQGTYEVQLFYYSIPSNILTIKIL
jgi:hypothetical protein